MAANYKRVLIKAGVALILVAVCLYIKFLSASYQERSYYQQLQYLPHHIQVTQQKVTLNCSKAGKDVFCVNKSIIQEGQELEVIMPLAYPGKALTAMKNHSCQVKISSVDTVLSPKENETIKACVKRFKSDYAAGYGKFWSNPTTRFIRHTHHKYLNKDSLIIDVGGNIGYDAQKLINISSPHTLIMLEPINCLYSRLLEKFKNYRNVRIYNLGLGKRSEKIMVNVRGNSGDATSILDNGGGNCPLTIVNAKSFFERLGIGCYEIDLITINCEGCEYDLVETLVSTNLIKFFKHVQFGTHVNLPRLKDPVLRYCRLQELLSKTHIVGYQYKYAWESWTRKDISQGN